MNIKLNDTSIEKPIAILFRRTDCCLLIFYKKNRHRRQFSKLPLCVKMMVKGGKRNKIVRSNEHHMMRNGKEHSLFSDSNCKNWSRAFFRDLTEYISHFLDVILMFRNVPKVLHSITLPCH
ncbi:hypothetical protein CDAR_543251 [Caerostris darwini]|uniref:Uncharacterized protein n=1 Tax=Caerostris darwini TaxID=1538125 RepID=A0AAV4X196_9ARAC|nr:hypothetical protein CDAR_543251 [Caerostris darwini]